MASVGGAAGGGGASEGGAARSRSRSRSRSREGKEYFFFIRLFKGTSGWNISEGYYKFPFYRALPSYPGHIEYKYTVNELVVNFKQFIDALQIYGLKYRNSTNAELAQDNPFTAGFVTYNGVEVACIDIAPVGDSRIRRDVEAFRENGFYSREGPVSPDSVQGAEYLKFLRDYFDAMGIPEEMPLDSITNVGEGVGTEEGVDGEGGGGAGEGGSAGEGGARGLGLGGGSIKSNKRKKFRKPSKSKSKSKSKKSKRRKNKKKTY